MSRSNAGMGAASADQGWSSGKASSKSSSCPSRDCRGRCTAPPRLPLGGADVGGSVPVDHFRPSHQLKLRTMSPFITGRGSAPALPRCRPPRSCSEQSGRSGCGQRGQRCAVGIEPVDELLREQLGALAVEAARRGSVSAANSRVEQPVILDGPRDVVIAFVRRRHRWTSRRRCNSCQFCKDRPPAVPG